MVHVHKNGSDQNHDDTEKKAGKVTNTDSSKTKAEAEKSLSSGELNTHEKKVLQDKHKSGKSRATGFGKDGSGKGGLASAHSLIGDAKEQASIRSGALSDFQKKGWDANQLQGKKFEGNHHSSALHPIDSGASAERLEAAVKDLHSKLTAKNIFGQYTPDKTQILQVFETLSHDDRQRLEKLYNALYKNGGHNLRADLQAAVQDKNDRTQLMKALDLRSGESNVSGQISWALAEINKGFGGHNLNMEKVIVNAISTCNSQEIAQLTKNGFDPKSELLANPKLSSESKKALTILLSGKDQVYNTNGQMKDQYVHALTEIALSKQCPRLDLFQMAFQSASTKARADFKSSGGEARMDHAFGGREQRIARDYLNTGAETSISHIAGDRLVPWVFVNKEDVSKHMLAASKTQDAKLYEKGELLANGAKIKSPNDQKALDFYKSMRKELEQSGNAREVKTWEAQLIGAQTIIGKLSACHKDSLNPLEQGHNLADLSKTVEELSRQDWNRFRENPNDLKRVDELLHTFASDSERKELMSMLQKKINVADKTWTFEESQRVGKRASTDILSQNKLGFLEQLSLKEDDSAARKIDALLSMSDVERRAWRDPKSAFHKELNQLTDSVFQVGMERDLAHRILSKIQMNQKPDAIDRVLIDSVKGASLSQTIKNIEDAYAQSLGAAGKHQSLQERFNHPRNNDDSILSGYFSIALVKACQREGFGDENRVPPYWVQAQMDLLKNGHVSLALKLELNKNKDVQLEQIASASEKERAALLGRKPSHESQSQLSIADQCRALTLGYGSSESLKARLESLSASEKQLLANDYYRSYKKSLIDDVSKHVNASDQNFRHAFSEFPRPSKQTVLDCDAERAQRPESTWDSSKDGLDESVERLLAFERRHSADIAKLPADKQAQFHEAIKRYESAKEQFINSKGQQAESLANAAGAVIAVGGAFFTEGVSLELLGAIGVSGGALRLGIIAASEGKDFNQSPENILKQVFHGSTDAVLSFVAPEMLGLKFGAQPAKSLLISLDKAGLSSSKHAAIEASLNTELSALTNKDVLLSPARVKDRVEQIFEHHMKELPPAQIEKLSDAYLKEIKKEAAIRLIASEMKQMGISVGTGSGAAALTEVASTAVGLEKPEDLFERMYHTASEAAIGGTVFHFAFKSVGAGLQGARGLLGKDPESHALWGSNGVVVRHADNSITVTGKDKYYFRHGDRVIEPMSASPEMSPAARKQSHDFAEGRNQHSVSGKLQEGFTDAGPAQRMSADGKIHSNRAGIVYDSRHDQSLNLFKSEAKQHLDKYKAEFSERHKRAPNNGELLDEAIKWQNKRLGTQTEVQEKQYTSFVLANPGRTFPVGELLNRNILSCSQRATLLKLIADENIAPGYAKLVRGDATGSNTINHLWVEALDGKQTHVWDPNNERLKIPKSALQKDTYTKGDRIKSPSHDYHEVHPGCTVDGFDGIKYAKDQPADHRFVALTSDVYKSVDLQNKLEMATLAKENPGLKLEVGQSLKVNGEDGFVITRIDNAHGDLELKKADALKMIVPRDQLHKRLPELNSMPHINKLLTDAAALPMAQRKQTLLNVVDQLANIADKPLYQVNYRDFDTVCSNMALLENKLRKCYQDIANEVKVLSKEVPSLKKRTDLTNEERKKIADYEAGRDTLRALIQRRLETVYAWDGTAGMRMKGGHVQDGFNAERNVANTISDMLTNNELGKALADAGVSPARCKGWVGIPTKGSADHAGCDYLLVNKLTGEMIPFDVTLKVEQMNANSMAESRLTNPALEIKKDNVGKEREKLVIGVRNVDLEDMRRSHKLSPEQAAALVDKQLHDDLLNILVRTINEDPKQRMNLHIIRSAFPGAQTNSPLSRQYFELWRFRQQLITLGYNDWAAKVDNSMDHCRIADNRAAAKGDPRIHRL